MYRIPLSFCVSDLCPAFFDCLSNVIFLSKCVISEAKHDNVYFKNNSLIYWDFKQRVFNLEDRFCENREIWEVEQKSMNILTMRHVVHAILIHALRKRINKAFRFIFRILGSLNCFVHICILLKNCSFFVEMNAFKTLQKSSSYSKQFRDNFLQLAFSFFLFFVSRCLYSR